MTEVLSADWVLPIAGAPIERGAVAFEGGRVVAVGPASKLGEGERFADSVIVPGLVNAHTHLEYAVYAGFGDGQPFGPWLHTHIERKARIGAEEFLAIARLGAAECLGSGVTTIADASFSGAAAVAASELGLRGIVAIEVFGVEAGRADGARRRIVELKPALDPRVRLGVSPHAPYSVSTDLYRAAYELELPVVTHLAESQDEVDYLRDGSGPISVVSEIAPSGLTPVRHLAVHDLLGPNLLAAHCVKVDQEEIALLAEHDVAVAHCPRSNSMLGCGFAPLTALRAAGLRTAWERTARPRLPRSTSSRKCGRPCSPRGGARRGRMHSPAGKHSNSLRLEPQGRSISRTRSGRSVRASALISRSSRSPGRRTCPGRTPPRRSSSGGRPTEFCSPSSTARSATGKEGSDGTSFVATPPPRAHAYSTEKRRAQAPSQ
ncbi:MAG TPA: amidohydrolase family protein [Gaiellaceae bacterium]|nr:amidohydrolase family protein [Gaiellaceae bacterium]